MENTYLMKMIKSWYLSLPSDIKIDLRIKYTGSIKGKLSDIQIYEVFNKIKDFIENIKPD